MGKQPTLKAVIAMRPKERMRQLTMNNSGEKVSRKRKRVLGKRSENSLLKMGKSENRVRRKKSEYDIATSSFARPTEKKKRCLASKQIYDSSSVIRNREEKNGCL